MWGGIGNDGIGRVGTWTCKYGNYTESTNGRVIDAKFIFMFIMMGTRFEMLQLSKHMTQRPLR